MADRYWVGGNGTWSATNTTNWSSTSGGSGGASVPTSSDNVVFDTSSNSSGVLTVTVAGGVQCNGFYNNRDAGAALKLVGSSSDSISVWGYEVRVGLTAGSGDYSSAFCWFVIYTPSTNILDAVVFTGSNVVRNIRITKGQRARFSFVAGSGTIDKIVLEDQAYIMFDNSTKVLSIEQQREFSGTYTTVNIQVGAFSTSSTAKLSIGGAGVCLKGSFQITSSSVDAYAEITGLIGDAEIDTIYASISRLVINPSVAGRTFKLSSRGGLPSYNLSTITTLERKSGSLAFTLSISPDTDYRVSNFNMSGDVSNTITVKSSVSDVRAKLTKTTAGIVETNYMEVKDMQPYPDNTWISYNSTNAGNNWQWYFNTFNKPTSCLFFGSHV